MPRLDVDDRRKLVGGAGRYVGDIRSRGALDVCFVRSILPFARLAGVELRTDAGVTASGLGLRPLVLDGRGLAPAPWNPLAMDVVRYVGEPIAAVWAPDRYLAEDAADRVEVEYSELLPGTPVHAEAPDGRLFWTDFDSGGLDALMAEANVVLERTFKTARQSAAPLECRGVVAEHDATSGVTTISTSTQVPHLVRRGIAAALGCDVDELRVLVPHVGGGFGLKAHLGAEEIVVAALARHLGRPVRWLEDRRENLVASFHAHDTRVSMRVGVSSNGRILAVDADVEADVGAHSAWPFSASLEAATAAFTLFGPYDVGAIRYRARAVASNRCPVGAHRGVGMNAGVFATERMMDEIAAELHIDPLELRRLNAVPRTPTVTAGGRRLDSGDYGALLEKLDREAGYRKLREWQTEERTQGRVLGIGIGFFNEHSGGGSADYQRRGVSSIPGHDAARVRVTEEGRVEIYTSAAEAGQGHAETYRKLTERELGIEPGRVDVIEGDTAQCPDGTGTFASRGAVGVAESVVQALRKAAEHDLVPGTDVTVVHDPHQVFPCGAHLAVVEVDPVGLIPRVVRYVVVEDCGTIIDQALVDDQIRGGVATGIGDVLLEEHVYSADGQILSATLLDYLLPLAPDVPRVEIHHLSSPSPDSAIGSKGVGEAGTIGAFAAVANAVADAVRPLGGSPNDLPYSPARIFEALYRERGNGDPRA